MIKTSHSEKKHRLVPLDILIHFLCYLFVNALLVFLNLITNPYTYLWFTWPLNSWGIALLMHIGIRYIVKRKWRSGVKFLVTHLLLFAIMSLYFIFIDTFSGYGLNFPINWSYFPITAWFSMILAHTLSYLFIQVREPPEATQRRKQFHLFNSWIVHLFIFLCANTYMLIINFLTGFNVQWYLYPLGATLLALSIHLLVVLLEIIPIQNIQLKILLYHLFLFILVSAYLIFEDWLQPGVTWWYWTVGGWSIGILLHLIYYYTAVAVKKSKK